MCRHCPLSSAHIAVSCSIWRCDAAAASILRIICTATATPPDSLNMPNLSLSRPLFRSVSPQVPPAAVASQPSFIVMVMMAKAIWRKWNESCRTNFPLLREMSFLPSHQFPEWKRYVLVQVRVRLHFIAALTKKPQDSARLLFSSSAPTPQIDLDVSSLPVPSFPLLFVFPLMEEGRRRRRRVPVGSYGDVSPVY